MSNPNPQPDPQQPSQEIEKLLKMLTAGAGPLDGQGENNDADLSEFFKEGHNKVNAAKLGLRLYAYLTNYLWAELAKESNPILRIRGAWVMGQMEVAGKTLYESLANAHALIHDLDEFRLQTPDSFGVKEYDLGPDNPMTGIIGPKIVGITSTKEPMDAAGRPLSSLQSASTDAELWADAHKRGLIP